MPGQVVGTARLLEPDDIFEIKYRNVCAAQILHQKWVSLLNAFVTLSSYQLSHQKVISLINMLEFLY